MSFPKKDFALSLPEVVFELLALLSSRGGRMPIAEIPDHLQNALLICKREPRLVVYVPVAGALNANALRPKTLKMTSEGEGVLALRHEVMAERTPLEAAGNKPPLSRKEPPPSRLTVDQGRMGATLDGVFLDCNSKQALRLLSVYASHPGVWISATELKKYDAELDGAKPHVLKKLLPPRICTLIQSDRRKGSRLWLS